MFYVKTDYTQGSSQREIGFQRGKLYLEFQLFQIYYNGENQQRDIPQNEILRIEKVSPKIVLSPTKMTANDSMTAVTETMDELYPNGDWYWFWNHSFSNFTNISNININDTDCKISMDEVYFQAAVTFMYFAIFCVALLGNGAVCFIVIANPRMRTVTNYFIANLALGDILMSLFCVPFSFVSSLILYYWPFGSVLCRLVNYSQVVSVLVSAYTLVALAADRYRAITAPLRPRLSKPKAKAAIAAVWVGALATAVPTPIFSSLLFPTEAHVTCNKSICRETWPTFEQEHYYSMALMTLQFAVPLSVLVFTYARIAMAVWGGRPPGEAENSRDKRMAKSKRKMVKMMIVVVVVFIICWLPYNALLLLYNDSWDDWWPLQYLWFITHWLAMSHSCYNPIIYWYMNARFRAGFLQTMEKYDTILLSKVVVYFDEMFYDFGKNTVLQEVCKGKAFLARRSKSIKPRWKYSYDSFSIYNPLNKLSTVAQYTV
ncbi:RYamide receptor-like [Arctopsyche grandis]|uniref:RYamide receptor-like n=1 Tax=Arctopsyche grandis TaxID=121162 RepID=UPI00406D78A2